MSPLIRLPPGRAVLRGSIEAAACEPTAPRSSPLTPGAAGDLPKLRRRLEADAKSLYALYEYGRLHGAVRLRWGFLDERLPAPWTPGHAGSSRASRRTPPIDEDDVQPARLSARVH